MECYVRLANRDRWRDECRGPTAVLCQRPHAWQQDLAYVFPPRGKTARYSIPTLPSLVLLGLWRCACVSSQGSWLKVAHKSLDWKGVPNRIFVVYLSNRRLPPLAPAYQVDEHLQGVEPLDYQVFEVDAMGVEIAQDSYAASADETGGVTNETSWGATSSVSGNFSNENVSSSSSSGSDAATTATWNKLVSNLETGKEFYVRVSAQGDGVGYGMPEDASSNPVVPRGVPGQIGKAAISRVDAVTVKLEIEQNTATNGAEVEGYSIEWGTNPQFTSAQQLRLDPDYRIQAVRINAWQRGWTSNSAFSLSLFDFRGAFNARLGGDGNDSLATFVSISEGTNVLNRTTPNVTAGFGEAPLYKAVPRGGFVSVGGQEFRVCLDGKMPYDAETLTLCSTSDPYAPENFVGAATKYDNTLTQVPAYVLDTAIGSAFRLAVGDTALRTYDGPDTNISVNDLTSTLARGDHLRLGHPETGRVFTVCQGDGTSHLDFNATSLPLCSADDPEEEVSVMEGDIVSATYETQRFGLWLNTSESEATTWNQTEALGYRLMFGDETSATSQTGGHSGCLSFYSSVAEVKYFSVCTAFNCSPYDFFYLGRVMLVRYAGFTKAHYILYALLVTIAHLSIVGLKDYMYIYISITISTIVRDGIVP